MLTIELQERTFDRLTRGYVHEFQHSCIFSDLR